MGFNFRKSFNIGGIKLSVGKKGLSSVSMGVKGARVSLGKKGVRTTVSLPKTGMSYSKQYPFSRNNQDNNRPVQTNTENSKMSTGKKILVGFILLFLVIWIFG